MRRTAFRRLLTNIPIQWLLRDEFTTDRAAGSVNGTAAEPGPGLRTGTDTASKASISNGVLKLLPMTVPAWGDPGVWWPSRTRACGLAMLARINKQFTGFFQVGWDSNTSTVIYSGYYINDNATFYTYDNALNAVSMGGSAYPEGNMLQGRDYDFAVVLRDTGAYLLKRSSEVGDWRLIKVTPTSNATSLRPAISENNCTQVTVKSVQDMQLTGVWATQYGFASVYSASPATGYSANASNSEQYIEFTWTPASAETLDIQFRRVDDNNCWILRCDQAAGTIKLFEKISGTETERNTGKTQTWTIGTAYRIEILAYMATIRSFVAGAAQHAYASATSNQAASGVKVSGHTTGTNLACYPGTTSAIPGFNALMQRFYAIGDSKSLGGWQDELARLLNMSYHDTWLEASTRNATGGWTTSDAKNAIDAALAAYIDTTAPIYVFVDLGANDVTVMPAQATWEANMLYILDACLLKWPDAHIYITRPWRRNYASDCNTIATWINNMVAARPARVHLGPDERVYLENGDNGVTYTSDGTHPNTAGYTLVATQLKSAVGL